MTDRIVLHIAPRSRWDAVDTEYRDPSLDAEGFIHCSTIEQLLVPANERFAGRADLVVLVIDLDRVPAETIFEDCYDSGMAFPHIYGPIPVAAVQRVVAFPCNADGRFDLPVDL